MQIQRYVPRLSKTTAAQRQAWLQKYFSSGLSAQGFAQQQGLKPGTFYRWLAGAKQTVPVAAKPVAFQEVGLAPVPNEGNSSWAMEIITPAGLRLRLR